MGICRSQPQASSPYKIMNVLSIRYGLASCRNVVTDICCGLLGLLYFVVSLVDGLLACVSWIYILCRLLLRKQAFVVFPQLLICLVLVFLCVVGAASMVRVLLVSSFWLWPVCWFCNPFCMLVLVSQNVGNKNYLIIGKKKNL